MRYIQSQSVRIFTRCLLFGLLLLGGQNIFAQTDKIAFKKYGVAEGLPEEYVSGIVQDDQGFMWFTTQNGLVKYDGYDFQVYQYNPSKEDTNSLQLRNLGGGIIKGTDGKLWFGGFRSGLASFDPETEIFRNWHWGINGKQSIPFDFSLMLFEDSKKNIWFVNLSSEHDTTVLCRLDQQSRIIHSYPYSNSNLLSIMITAGMVSELPSDSSVWIMDETQDLMKWNPGQDTFEIIIPSGSVIPGTDIQDSLSVMISGSEGTLQLSGQQSFYIWDPVDRKIIRTFKHEPENPESLSSAEINLSMEDDQGNYWVLHSDGIISYINTDHNIVQRLEYGEGALDFSHPSRSVDLIAPIHQNQDEIWFQVFFEEGPVNYFCYRYASDTFHHFDAKFNYENNPTSLLNTFFFLFEDRTGLLWLRTRPNFYKQDPKAQQMELFRHHDNDPNSLPSDTIYSIFEDSKQRLWVGTSRGLGLFQPKLDNFRVFKHDFNDKLSISNNDINLITEDNEGRIWVSTDNGLNQLDESNMTFKRFYFEPGETNFIGGLLFDKVRQYFWVSIFEKGVFVFDPKSGTTIKSFKPGERDTLDLSSNRIRSIFQDSEGVIWMGDRDDNDQGIFKYDERFDGFVHYALDADNPNSISSNEIDFFGEDYQNRIWVGTDGGIHQFIKEENRFIHYNENIIPSTACYNFDKNGKTWIGTYSGAGLVSIDAETGEMKVYGKKQGLTHTDLVIRNATRKFLVDNNGRFWLPNQRGLSVFDPEEETFTNYFEKDGFQPYGRIYLEIQTKNGDIWIGGLHGLNRIQPSLLLKKDPSSPEVLITSMTIMGDSYSAPDGNIFEKAVSYTQKINLQYWQKDFAFEFVALHYLRPEENRYSWILENYDEAWSDPSLERRVGYTNLRPGSYTFRVKGSNADGIWNEEAASIKIIIAPPWWKSVWAYIFYGLCIIAGIIVIDRIQRRRLTEKERNQAREKELEQAKEIEQAYTELKATQSQLIHSEKMASLGELTAGIAHEIQNPLNFVNNFSEVSVDLIEEMNEEVDNNDLDEVKNISGDLKQNLEMIHHHGRRASSIVKGMLEHSRAGNGKKELTDLNALADEYLRLAYYGLRAKDKSFNADFKLEEDKNLQKVPVVSQDIGRVLLNLINNAFYTVSKKAGKETEGYVPKVVVKTKNLKDKVEIIVKDNGDGIPDGVLDKIFQPFFTTKPTGQGTGLGLSMSYDIITNGHKGKLEVKTKEGFGTEFIIILPV